MKNTHEIVATHLAEAKRTRRPMDRLPEETRPKDNEAALATQRRVMELMQERVGGWKCSVPNGERILLAPLPASTINRNSPCPILPKGNVAEIEPEIAFVLSHDLTPRPKPYSEDEVRDAVGEVRLVLELIGSRYREPESISWLELLADSVKHQGMYIGPVISDAWQKQLESFHLKLGAPEGILFDREVKHPNGHPARPLYWLANFLTSRGETLKAGSVVTTGSYAGIIEAPMESPLTFNYGSLGSFSVRFVL
jgi:2-keto-4-pentenoate hydratase